MTRGGAVAQFQSEARKVPLGLKISESANRRLVAAYEEEMKSPRNSSLTKTELAAHLLDYGLTLYFARDNAGAERFLAVVGANGGDEEAAFADLIRRGLDSWEAEHGKKKR